MAIHHSIFVFLFLIAAVITEDVQASNQGTVLIFTFHIDSVSIMVVTL